MQKFKYNMSVIVPIYNMEKYLDKCLNSIIDQEYDFSKIEVIAINDGSTDNSLSILEEYKSKYDNIVVINQENQGVSKSRNNGIKVSRGKYIMYLDPDDTIGKDTIGSLISFFDEHYNEIDLLTYKIIPVTNGKLAKKLHYRYEFLNHDGIYDLDKYIYACVTTINYCVKNLGSDNVYFDETSNRQEDQKYALDVISKKMKIGYITSGTYYYLQQENSATHSKFYAYYIWDKTMLYWENEFNKQKKVSRYLQALFINDLSWKLRKDILFPYQYEGLRYKKEIKRLQNLLNQVEDDVILNHPGTLEEHKHYFIDLKTNNNFVPILGNHFFSIMNNNKLIYSIHEIKLNVLKLKIYDGYIKIIGYLFDPIFNYTKKPKLYIIDRYNLNKKIEVPLRESSYSYFKSKVKVSKSYMFEENIDTNIIKEFGFEVAIDDKIINCEYSFDNSISPFGNSIGRNVVFKYNKKYEISQNNKSLIISDYKLREKRFYKRLVNSYYFYNDFKRYIFRKMISTFKVFKHKKVWLYYDCKGVEKDNAYYQFIHDRKQKDGIKKYYVSANSKEDINKLFSFSERRKVIKFNSLKHKLYYTIADKVITAYVENENCSPYTISSLKNYSDLFDKPEIIYLQHGVLHAHTPWKYSFDRILVDKEVVSSNYEKENLKESYSFTDEHLLESGMPRYDFISQHNKPKKVILYAPSWRKYLIGRIKNKWIATDSAFTNSTFYKETYNFLNSDKLIKLLEKYDYVLNFKLHPIFKPYQKFYNIKSDRIKISESKYKDSDYSIFITDFSSYVFDFVYLKRAILYFFPDYDLFKAGLNDYRELDLKFEDGFGPFIESSNDLIKELETLLKNKCIPSKKYLERNNNFFLYNDNKQRERIYNEIIK